jgi:hypothetical protein
MCEAHTSRKILPALQPQEEIADAQGRATYTFCPEHSDFMDD